MDNNYSIKILNPCPKEFNDLQNLACGNKFCDSCVKKIYDFTSKTKAEIKKVYDANEGNICGIFTQEQITPIKNKLYYKWLARFAFSILLAFGTNFYSYGQETDIKVRTIKIALQDSVCYETIIVNGKVKNHFNIDELNVYYKDSLLTTIQLDEKGRFTLEIPGGYENKELGFKPIGLYRKKYALVRNNDFLVLNFKKAKIIRVMGCPSF